MSEKTPRVGNGGPSGFSRMQRPLGLAFIVVGAVLLVLVGGYYLYGIRAKAAIDDHTSERPRPVPNVSVAPAELEAPAQPSPAAVAAVPSSPTPAATPETRPEETAPTPTAASVEAIPTPIPEAATAAPTPGVGAPGERTGPSGLGRVLGGGATSTATAGQTQEAPAATPTPDYAAIIEQDLRGSIEASMTEALKYAPVSSTQLLAATSLPAVRIRIPVVGIDSDIKELEIIDDGDSRAWETPKHIVGHIPTTGFPGHREHGWYFGHLESPFSGEGNVFGRLPDLAELFTSREESSFYVFLESEDLKFVYQIYRTEIVHSRDFGLRDSGESDITLVTCYPRFTYDHRLLITAALVGVRES